MHKIIDLDLMAPKALSLNTYNGPKDIQKVKFDLLLDSQDALPSPSRCVKKHERLQSKEREARVCSQRISNVMGTAIDLILGDKAFKYGIKPNFIGLNYTDFTS